MVPALEIVNSTGTLRFRLSRQDLFYEMISVLNDAYTIKFLLELVYYDIKILSLFVCYTFL